MSALHNNPFLLASGSPTDPTFPLQRSVRLRGSASAYFSRTLASTTNRRTFTQSLWLKRGALGTDQYPLFAFNGGNTLSYYLTFDSVNRIAVASNIEGVSNNFNLLTTQVFRDPSAWYHVVVAMDTTQATSSDRLKIYINGVQVTVFTTATYPSLNFDNAWNNSAIANTIGRNSTSTFDGYITELNVIDGQALTPSSFGGYNSGTGVWEPRKYAGTYGTNGFYLNFQDNSGATATTIGKDSSGNSNNWTPNNISVTAGVTYDSMLDVPTNTSATNANFPTWNPLVATGQAAPTDGNLSQINSTGCRKATMPFPQTGKWYMEWTAGSNTMCTVTSMLASNTAAATADSSSVAYYTNGNKYLGGTGTTYGSSFASGTVIGLALDFTVSPPTITFYNANTAQPTLNLTSGIDYVVAAGIGGTGLEVINFGQRPFSYTPPTGFKALNTYNLPEPTIASGDDFHKVYTYTGNGGGLQVGEIQKPASLFNLDRSLRFRASNSAYLSRTLTTPTNNTVWSWSGWVKVGQLGTTKQFFGGSGTNYGSFGIENTDQIRFWNNAGTGVAASTAVFRDPFAWYHVVVISNGTTIKAYVNNAEVLSYTGTITNINSAIGHQIGRFGNLTYYLDGYLADVYFIDGQALTPTDFGAYDGNYYWTPKAYTGTYGTNGFHLEFEDNSAATAATIGKDTSGNVNNWTPNGISVTAGVTYDSMTDVPTQTSTDVANFATFNPLDTNSGTITNANLSSSLTVTGTTGRQSRSTFIFPSSGKFYFEVKPSSLAVVGQIGVVKSSAATNGGNGITPAFSTGDVYLYLSNGQKQDGVTASAYGASYTTSNLIGVAVDIDAGTLTFYKDNASQGIAYSGLTLSNYYPVVHSAGSVGTASYDINFGQRPFTYTPPTGFKSFNSFNVAEVTTDLESPDFVWIKSRSAATGHALFNSVTGVGKYLSSNATTAETTDVNSLIQFNKNGFLLGNAAIVNTSAATYVASAWKGGGAAVTNTAGSISSQVSANQKAGFSIVTYTGTGANATVGHGLGVAPKMMLFKGRNVVSDWVVYHANIGNTGALILNQTIATSTSINYWNNTSPTSSVFTIGIAGGVNNSSSNTYVAYCFSEIAGFSKFGSYTGNGSADGTFVFTGFMPRWIMIKCTSAAGTNWFIEDTSRNTYNPSGKTLQGDTATAEANNTPTIDLLSNGFKLRSTYSSYNTSGGTYVYAAFAESPFKFSLAR